MDTSLERIRAKIAELEAKIADLRIAEREIRALEKLPSRKTRPGPGPKPKPKRKPEASNQAEARQTIGADSVDHGSNSASNRCVFVVSSLAGIVLKLPRVSYPAEASAATRDAKCLGAGRERPQGLSRPFSSCRMWSVSAGF